jgi:ADP-ribose pyrophosphatase
MKKKTEIVLQTEWFNVERESFDYIRSLEGNPFYRVNAPDGVLILALTEESKIILVRQFRPAAGKYTLEFPSGTVDRSESPEEAAARELREETGYVCKTLHCLGTGNIMLSRVNSRQLAFLGEGGARDADYQSEVGVDVILVTQDEFRTLVTDGQFRQLRHWDYWCLPIGSWLLSLRGLAGVS